MSKQKKKFGASWAHLGASWSRHGASWARHGASWSAWSASLTVLDAFMLRSQRGMPLRRAPGKPNYQDEGNLTKETLHRKTTYREGVYESECMRVSV